MVYTDILSLYCLYTGVFLSTKSRYSTVSTQVAPRLHHFDGEATLFSDVIILFIQPIESRLLGIFIEFSF